MRERGGAGKERGERRHLFLHWLLSELHKTHQFVSDIIANLLFNNSRYREISLTRSMEYRSRSHHPPSRVLHARARAKHQPSTRSCPLLGLGSECGGRGRWDPAARLFGHFRRARQSPSISAGAEASYPLAQSRAVSRSSVHTIALANGGVRRARRHDVCPFVLWVISPGWLSRSAGVNGDPRDRLSSCRWAGSLALYSRIETW